MAKKPTTTRTLDSDVARELEKALDLDLSGDGSGDLDIAASMDSTFQGAGKGGSFVSA